MLDGYIYYIEMVENGILLKTWPPSQTPQGFYI